eukprot:1157240-Pelagomonas_calceolata.AAC.4
MTEGSFNPKEEAKCWVLRLYKSEAQAMQCSFFLKEGATQRKGISLNSKLEVYFLRSFQANSVKRVPTCTYQQIPPVCAPAQAAAQEKVRLIWEKVDPHAYINRYHQCVHLHSASPVLNACSSAQNLRQSYNSAFMLLQCASESSMCLWVQVRAPLKPAAG